MGGGSACRNRADDPYACTGRRGGAGQCRGEAFRCRNGSTEGSQSLRFWRRCATLARSSRAGSSVFRKSGEIGTPYSMCLRMGLDFAGSPNSPAQKNLSKSAPNRHSPRPPDRLDPLPIGGAPLHVALSPTFGPGSRRRTRSTGSLSKACAKPHSGVGRSIS